MSTQLPSLLSEAVVVVVPTEAPVVAGEKFAKIHRKALPLDFLYRSLSAMVVGLDSTQTPLDGAEHQQPFPALALQQVTQRLVAAGVEAGSPQLVDLVVDVSATLVGLVGIANQVVMVAEAPAAVPLIIVCTLATLDPLGNHQILEGAQTTVEVAVLERRLTTAHPR